MSYYIGDKVYPASLLSVIGINQQRIKLEIN